MRYRATRITKLIEERIAANKKFTVEDVREIQKDEYSMVAAAVVPTILDMANTAAKNTNVYKLLKNWDFYMLRESQAAYLFQLLLTRLMSVLVFDELKASQGFESLTSAPGFLDFIVKIFGPKSQPEDRERWCDDISTKQYTETCAEVLSSIMTNLDLQPLKNWGDAHQIQLNHFPFSNSTLLRAFLHQTVAVGGAQDTVNAQDFSRSSADFSSTSGPNMRLVADMAGGGYWGIETVRTMQGQSGNFLSPHYSDMSRSFHYGLGIDWQTDGQDSRKRLVLVPT